MSACRWFHRCRSRNLNDIEHRRCDEDLSSIMERRGLSGPQQFQQQTRWDAYVADVVAHMSLSSPWGVISAEFDESALAVFRLNPVNLVVRFPDGTLVDTSVSDNLPPACDLSHLTGYNSVDVVLALPLLSANGGNLSLGGGVSRPCRWQQEWLPVQTYPARTD